MEFIKEQAKSRLKRAQLDNFVKKAWGYEEWIVNNPKYCGKKLILYKGWRCSMHYHKIKEETFYVLTGKILFETELNGQKKIKVIERGDIEHISIGLLHRFTGLEDSEIIEFSTFHMDKDSYRREISGKIEQKEMDILLKKANL